MMTGLSVLLLGIGLGLRHATDADHIVVISTLLQREPGAARAARIAALWGAGHTATLLGIGLMIVFADLRVPPQLEQIAELLVAAMLLGFGAWHLLKSRAKEGSWVRRELSGASTYTPPVLVGLVHGLAGSAGVALLATTTIASRLWAAAYLGLFGLGTVLGMVLLTLALSWPISWTMRREGHLPRTAAAAAALLNVGLGFVLLVEALYQRGSD